MSDDAIMAALLGRGRVPAPSIELQRLASLLHEQFDLPAVDPPRVGRYVVGERIDSGGQGVVYRAHDPSLDRAVAIKLLETRPGMLGEAELMDEARALARLEHPNVLQVFDVGIHDGRAFLALPLIEGPTLRTVLNAESPMEVQRLRTLFEQAARGLAAAHDRGVVHCDFKPSNVLVALGDRVLVADFGLARLTGPAARTGTAVSTSDGTSVPGTAAYQAPEQTDGAEVSAACDQFAFGVALWEAMYGSRPYEAANMDAMWAAKRSGPPTPPQGAVPRRLAGVVRRCLAPRPGDRFPSMHAVAKQLRPRAQLPRVAAVLVFTTVGVAGVVAVAGGRDARRCDGDPHSMAEAWTAHATTVRAAVLATEASYAETTWSTARSELDAFATEWSGVHRATCRARRDKEIDDAALDLRMACLAEARQRLVFVVDRLQGAKPGHAADLGPLVSSLVPPRLCRTPAPPTGAALGPDQRPVHTALSAELQRVRWLGHGGSGEETLQLARAKQLEARNHGFEDLAAEATLVVGLQLASLGRYDLAHHEIETAALAAREVGADALALEAASEMVALLGRHLSRFDEALTWVRHAEASLERLGGNEPGEASLRQHEGIVLSRLDRHTEAVAAFRRALELNAGQAGDRGYSVGVAHVNLGGALFGQGKVDAAVEHWVEGRTILEERLGADHPALADVTANLGTAALRSRDFERARKFHARALEIHTTAHGPEHPRAAQFHNDLGVSARALGDVAAAKEHFAAGLRLLEAHGRQDEGRYAVALASLGNLAADAGEVDEAIAYYGRAMVAAERIYGPDHSRTAKILEGLARAYAQAERTPEALQAARRALKIRTEGEDPRPEETASLREWINELAGPV